MWLNQFTSGILFSVKNQKKFLAINKFVNETKSGQLDKHLFSLTFRELNVFLFLLRSSFFSTIRPLASSDATAYYQPAPGIPERDQRQWI